MQRDYKKWYKLFMTMSEVSQTGGPLFWDKASWDIYYLERALIEHRYGPLS